ncbi:MAG TPA: hypothetical protein VF950_09255 [Planctomycetota bacterium]
MAAPKASSGGAGALVAISAILGAGLIGLTVWLHGETAREEERLDRAKREYREMVDRMKPAVTEYLKNAKRPGSGPANEDLMTFLSRKANAAAIPAAIFRLQRNQELKVGPWREQSYTVNLQGTKDAPISRDAVASLVRLVETERPAVRVKNLAFAFAGDGLGSASLTFSAFDRDGGP